MDFPDVGGDARLRGADVCACGVGRVSNGKSAANPAGGGGYVCIAYGVTIRFQKQQWFFLAALVILLLLVLICRQQVLEGYRLFWNQMRNTYTAGTGWVLPEWGDAAACGEKVGCA